MSFLNLLSAFVVTSIWLFALKPVAGKVGLVDIPGGRKEHKAPTPLVGGVGIYFGTLFICLFTPVVLTHYAMMLTLSALVLVVGIFDDARELRVCVRMGAHGFAALAMAIVAGNQLTSVGNILGFGAMQLGILAIPMTVFATVGVINAVNMADGVDGLSGGLVVIALLFLGIVAFESGNVPMLQFATLLICALLAFLMLNFRLPWKQCALIYMGDAGSTMLGFMLTWLIIEATQGTNAAMAPVYALWFMAIPLIDTVSLLIKRPLEGRSPFSAGTDHLHHRLLRAGYSRKQTVLGLYAASVVMGSIGLAGFLMQTSEAMMFLLFMILFGLYMAWDRLYQKLSSPRPANSLR